MKCSMLSNVRTAVELCRAVRFMATMISLGEVNVMLELQRCASVRRKETVDRMTWITGVDSDALLGAQRWN